MSQSPFPDLSVSFTCTVRASESSRRSIAMKLLEHPNIEVDFNDEDGDAYSNCTISPGAAHIATVIHAFTTYPDVFKRITLINVSIENDNTINIDLDVKVTRFGSSL